MGQQTRTCPHCLNQLSPESILDWRPFSCPHCLEFIAPRSAYSTYARIGCLFWPAALCTVAILLGLHWFLGLALGIGGAILLNVYGFRLITKRWPQPPRLHRYECRTQVDFRSLAELLDSILSAEGWNERFDHQFRLFWDARSGDDLLEEAALDSADAYRATLTVGKPQKKNRQIPDLPLEEQRRRLRLIAADLRLVATQLEANQSSADAVSRS